MDDPTTPTGLAVPASWPGPTVDLRLAARAARYLRDNGLEPHAIATALQNELDVPAGEALRLATGRCRPAPPVPQALLATTT